MATHRPVKGITIFVRITKVSHTTLYRAEHEDTVLFKEIKVALIKNNSLPTDLKTQNPDKATGASA
jgi:hypothetical protein